MSTRTHSKVFTGMLEVKYLSASGEDLRVNPCQQPNLLSARVLTVPALLMDSLPRLMSIRSLLVDLFRSHSYMTGEDAEPFRSRLTCLG